MKTQQWLWISLLAMVAGLTILRSPHRHAGSWSQAEASESNPPSRVKGGLGKINPIPPKSPAIQAGARPGVGAEEAKSARERRSLHIMAEIFAHTFHGDRSKFELLRGLISRRQEPILAVDHQPRTGDLTILRTNQPPPGTRYFHAQYFSNGTANSELLQHLSFEYKPSLESMDQAVEAVREVFPELTSPVIRRSDFVQWNLAGDYVMWIKKLDAGELANNPFNAYTAADTGTIRVAIELKSDED